jgi:hypothetical protein
MSERDGFSQLAQALIDKSLTKEELFNQVKQDSSLIPDLLRGVQHSKAAVRYGCAKVLMDLSEECPEEIYPYMDSFIELLDSKYRILTWNALAIIANLAKVDVNKRFDAAFDKYYGFLKSDYMVTVANVVGNSSKIVQAKPYLIPQVTEELLKVEDISITPHLTEECRRVIAQKTIQTLSQFFDQVERKERVVSFVEAFLGSSREGLKREAERFLEKWC